MKDCPAGKLKLDEKKAVYTPECIQCGHCVAVCPQAAVSIPEYDMGDVEEFDKENVCCRSGTFPACGEVPAQCALIQREAVEREKLERILQAGRYTPTAEEQPVMPVYRTTG